MVHQNKNFDRFFKKQLLFLFLLSFEKSLFETDSRMLRNSLIEVTHGLSCGSRTILVYLNLIKTVNLDLLESNSNKLKADHRKGLSKNRWKVCDLRHEVS